MLGWKVLKEGEYILNLPILSDEEETIIEEVETRFREVVRLRDFETPSDVKETLKDILIRVAEDLNLYVDVDQQDYLVDMAYRHIYGLLFVEDLLRDDSIEEIAVIGIGKPVYVYVREKGWKKVNVTITDKEVLMDLINKMAKSLGRRITLQHPRLDATLPDGSRLHASIPPISNGEITIRKFREKPLSFKQIVDFSTLTYEMAAVMSMFMQSDSSVVVSGNTASGKTTTLNALFSFVPRNERILITEEIPEINIPHEHTVRLVSNKEMGIDLMDLIYDSLRMRPDRVIVGEVRNENEVRALIDAFLGGQARGVYATFHAQSGQEAINRFISFGVSPLDINSIDVILVQRRILMYDIESRRNIEVRKVTEISLVEEGKALPVFIFNPKKGKWERRNRKQLILALSNKFGLDENVILSEISKRAKDIMSAPDEHIEFFKFIQSGWYTI